MLLLDEPTNHLDLDARNWLESYLIAYPHPVILVSHDRYFLDAVVTKIADLSLRTITDYIGTYSLPGQADARMNRLRKAKQEQDERSPGAGVHRKSVPLPGHQGGAGQSRIKMLDKVEIIEVPPERKRVHFTFPSCPKSGRMVVELTDARKAYGDLVVFDHLTMHIERGDRIALVAPNGAGKSTLMRMLSGAEAPDSGSYRQGHQVVMQHCPGRSGALDPTKTVYQTLEADAPIGMVPMIRNLLGGFLFAGDDIYKKQLCSPAESGPASLWRACC